MPQIFLLVTPLAQPGTIRTFAPPNDVQNVPARMATTTMQHALSGYIWRRGAEKSCFFDPTLSTNRSWSYPTINGSHLGLRTVYNRSKDEVIRGLKYSTLATFTYCLNRIRKMRLLWYSQYLNMWAEGIGARPGVAQTVLYFSKICITTFCSNYSIATLPYTIY